MSLSVRQQGEIAYLRGALGLDDFERRLLKLENRDESEVATLEERHSQGLAALAQLDVYPAAPFSPEGFPDPEREEGEEAPVMAGSVDESETVHETNPAVAANEDASVDGTPELDEYLASYNTLTVDELKQELKNRELSTSGSKDTLVARLEEDDKEA